MRFPPSSSVDLPCFISDHGIYHYLQLIVYLVGDLFIVCLWYYMCKFYKGRNFIMFVVESLESLEQVSGTEWTPNRRW